jgi:hypothetical protein
MALLQLEVQKTVAIQTVTKVNGPPTSNDLDLLKEELIAIAASIPSVLRGGMNGHAGMLLSNIDYATMALGSPLWCLSIPEFIRLESLQQRGHE